MSDSVKVAVRVRPINQREKALDSNVIVRMNGQQTTLEAPKYSNLDARLTGIREKSKPIPKRFGYDYSYWSADRNDTHYTSQEQIFRDLGTHVLDAALEGYNACVFAYGQTGSGKTYTMMGEKDDPGLTPRICKGLYDHVMNNSNQQESFRIEVSYLEIYNEQVWDLLRPLRPDKKEVPASRLRVREHPTEGPYVQGLTRHDAPDYGTVESFLNQGNFLRTTAATNMNDQSSRSHAIFTIRFTQAKFVAGLPSEVTSKVHLVDLAGSERVAKSGATGDRLKEGGNINRSLTTLGIVISNLAEKSQSDASNKKLFIPYRDSVLTWLLKDSLGGNSKTIMIAAISPADSSYGETLSTLRYADRAKNILNVPTVNEDPNVKLIRELKAEIERLKAIIEGSKENVTSLSTLENMNQAQKLLEGTESKMSKHLRAWAEKWQDTLHIIEESDLGVRKHGSALQINVDPPHLVLVDNDPLNTSITIFSLKEGDNLIGNSNELQTNDLVFEGDDIHTEHCVVNNDMVKVLLTPKDGLCRVNMTSITEPVKLCQGDIITLGEDIKLKFNFPLEANVLREKRRSQQFNGSGDSFSTFASSPLAPSEEKKPLSPVTDESGVEIDFFGLNEEDEITDEKAVKLTDCSVKIEVTELNNDGEYEKRTIDDLRLEVEELLAKYKESEILRFELESSNQLILEEKERDIHEQTKKLLEAQKNDEASLQRYQNELETLREDLTLKKCAVREALDTEITNLYDQVISKDNDELTDCLKQELKRYRESLSDQLEQQWSELDEYETKLIEIESEKQRTLDETEIKLRKVRDKSDSDKRHRLHDIEDEKSTIQCILENEIQEREVSRNEFKAKEKEVARCKKKLERTSEMLLKRNGELDSAKSRLNGKGGMLDEEEVSVLVENIKDFMEEIGGLEKDKERRTKKLATLEEEFCQKSDILKISEDQVEKRMLEFEGVRKKLAECQQQLGEELGDTVSIVCQERDLELEKIECEKESLLSNHLEHLIGLEVLVNEGFERLGAAEDESKSSEARERVTQLIRSESPGIESDSLQSAIVKKKVQIHLQQMGVSENEEERRVLYDKREEEYLALREAVQKERESEQNELIAKIKSLEEMLKVQGAETEESADYFESESSNLMENQRDILDMDRELREKMRERREIENQLESLNYQMELQAESSQEQFRDYVDDLRQRAKEYDEEIENMKKRFHFETDQYVMRLRRESFVVLEKTIVNSCYTHVGYKAAEDILREIEFASHVPELAETYRNVTEDCCGWRYEGRERNVDILRKETNDDSLHCFLGRGIIRTSVHSVMEAVSNPLSRFVYDRMLKNVRIVENIADELKVVYMLHETTHCFIKQSRDFCFVALEKEKDGKLILACQSVEHPNCPLFRGIVRAKILSSGWVIEPVIIEGEECSLVWYLTMVYLGSSLPTKLISFVSKRQPLSVAYLREYLTSER